ncbi:MAG: hypothetical protein M3421_08945 [Bacteroidota bacterium]|nr:hypothetical protein [Bacteroidota bacterium]
MKKIINYLIVGIVFTLFNSCSESDFAASPINNGIGGSMARFAINGDFLYAVDHHDLKVFDISTPGNPAYKQNINIGWGIETIFPYNQKLFIGSQTGMFIYDLTNPLKPVKLSMYQHLTACDPVVVQGDYAYVTLRSGTDCRFGQNLLDILNIKDPLNPLLISTTDMLSPHGLAVRDNNLFVCEGDFGIKIFDILNPDEPQLISYQEGFNAYDVIVLPNVLLITGKDGLYQYDYQDLQNLKLLSIIPVLDE